MGTKEIGAYCLSHLINSQQELEIDIIGVLTNDRKLGSDELSVSQLAVQNGINNLNNLKEFLALDDVDIVISVQYHEILKKIHLEKAKLLNVNLHMAPLPEYRGCNQFSFAILNNDNEFGTTLHVMDSGIDRGDIIAERRFPIPSDCFVDQLYEITFRESVDLFKECLPKLISGKFERIAQHTINDKKSELHYRNEIHELKEIQSSWDSEKILRHVRATAMPGFPPPQLSFGERKIKFIVE